MKAGIISHSSALRVSDLRCEYLSEPMGVDTPIPRFSWVLNDPTGARCREQRACRIMVFRAEGQGRIPIWDSGKVDSDQSVHIEYDGDPLASTWDCRWRVRIWDEQGQVSNWSDTARFVMGLLHPEDWIGDWITAPDVATHKHVWFRRTFMLETVPCHALAYVCSIGYHELYINGRRIGDNVLSPGVTNLAKRALYLTYDIHDALQPGANVIAIWLGPGWARADGSYGKGVWKQSPMFLVQCHAGQTPVCSDQAWRWCVSNSENIGLWKGGGEGTYGGERVDTRQQQPDWNKVSYDDTDWHPAVACTQQVILTSAMLEPDRKVETVTPVSIEEIDRAWRIDFGRNFTGWFEITLRGGQAGEVVQIHTSNRIEATMDYDQVSTYVFDESGEGTFCHRFNWMAGRWVTLHGMPDRPEANDIRGYVVTNDRSRYGHFECSDALLNAIYETDLRTYIANTVNGVVMDCPHRERYGYGEVALACAWGCAIPNYDSAAFYSKVLQDWCDVQSEDGMVNTIAPQPYAGAGGTLWSSAPVTLAWELYCSYGDKRLLEKSYPTLRKWLAFLAKSVGDRGVLEAYAKSSRFLGDWATPHGNEYGNIPEAQLFNNCVYVYDLMIAAEIADALGHVSHAEDYRRQLVERRRHIHAVFYNEEKSIYCDGRQMAMLFPLYVRVTPETLRDKVFGGFVDELNGKGYLDTGSPGLPILFKSIVEDLTKPELLLPVLTRTAYPGYGYFVARQESTWPEYWQIDGIRSRIHTCYTGVAGYMIRGLGGIQVDRASPGMRHVVIRPFTTAGLHYCRTTTATPYGTVECNWRIEGETMNLKLCIPPNSMATVYLDVDEANPLTESGGALEKAVGVKVVDRGDNIATIALASGEYHFSWSVPPLPEAL